MNKNQPVAPVDRKTRFWGSVAQGKYAHQTHYRLLPGVW
jgi:hypothetical protein